jgi:hypothetical protein
MMRPRFLSLTIYHCLACPFYRVMMDNPGKPTCGRMHRKRLPLDLVLRLEIPVWCPLPKAEQDEGAGPMPRNFHPTS